MFFPKEWGGETMKSRAGRTLMMRQCSRSLLRMPYFMTALCKENSKETISTIRMWFLDGVDESRLHCNCSCWSYILSISDCPALNEYLHIYWADLGYVKVVPVRKDSLVIMIKLTNAIGFDHFSFHTKSIVVGLDWWEFQICVASCRFLPVRDVQLVALNVIKQFWVCQRHIILRGFPPFLMMCVVRDAWRVEKWLVEQFAPRKSALPALGMHYWHQYVRSKLGQFLIWR